MSKLIQRLLESGLQGVRIERLSGPQEHLLPKGYGAHHSNPDQYPYTSHYMKTDSIGMALRRPSDKFVAFDQAGKVVGAVSFAIEEEKHFWTPEGTFDESPDKCVYVSNIGSFEPGLGRTLLKKVEEVAQTVGLAVMVAPTPSSLGFYRKAGYDCSNSYCRKDSSLLTESSTQRAFSMGKVSALLLESFDQSHIGQENPSSRKSRQSQKLLEAEASSEKALKAMKALNARFKDSSNFYWAVGPDSDRYYSNKIETLLKNVKEYSALYEALQRLIEASFAIKRDLKEFEEAGFPADSRLGEWYQSGAGSKGGRSGSVPQEFLLDKDIGDWTPQGFSEEELRELERLVRAIMSNVLGKKGKSVPNFLIGSTNVDGNVVWEKTPNLIDAWHADSEVTGDFRWRWSRRANRIYWNDGSPPDVLPAEDGEEFGNESLADITARMISETFDIPRPSHGRSAEGGLRKSDLRA